MKYDVMYKCYRWTYREYIVWIFFLFLHDLPVPTGSHAVVLVVPTVPDEEREAALIAIDKLQRPADMRAGTLAAVAVIAARMIAQTRDPRFGPDTPTARSQNSGEPRSQQDRAYNILRLKYLIVRESLFASLS